MTILSTCSILAYNCHFQEVFKTSPVGYLFHLFYFRSHHCNSFVDWTIFNIEIETTVVPEMPDEILAVTRTFWISLIQVVINVLLVLTTISMLGEIAKV